MKLAAFAAGSFPFTDISSSDAYYDAVKYVYNNGIMNGMTSTTFSPSVEISRGMFVTILYRIAGEPYAPAPTQFTDVASGRYFYDAVGWAVNEGITTGMTATTFEPDTIVTKQQVMTFLWRYVTLYKGISYDLPYEWNAATGSSALTDIITDYASVGNSAKEAVNWSLNCGIVSIYDTVFSPTQSVTRGDCAIYLHKFMTDACTGGGEGFFYICISELRKCGVNIQYFKII